MPELASLQTRLHALASESKARHWQTRLYFAHALARRIAAQPERNRAPALHKLEDALAGLEQEQRRSKISGSKASAQAGAASPSRCSALAELLRYLETASQQLHSAASPTTPGRSASQPARLKAAHFGAPRWDELRLDQQLIQALAHTPENAGPLNSHTLMSRSLQTLRQLAPAYLQHFLAYAETLLQCDPGLATPASPAPSGSVAGTSPAVKTGLKRKRANRG